jgi:uncharacterized protein
MLRADLRKLSAFLLLVATGLSVQGCVHGTCNAWEYVSRPVGYCCRHSKTGGCELSCTRTEQVAHCTYWICDKGYHASHGTCISDEEWAQGQAAKEVAAVQEACDSGKGQACFDAAELSKGNDVRERTFYEKACNAGYALGCTYLGIRVGSQDAPRQRSLYEKACDLGDQWACAEAVKMCRKGEGGPADEARIQALIEKGKSERERACDHGDGEACFALAEPLKNDDSVKRELHERACSAGHAQGCTYLGISLGSEEAPRQRLLYEKACNIGDKWACGRAAEMYRKGEGGPKDGARARELATGLSEKERAAVVACGRGNARACIDAAGFSKGDDARERDFIEKACKAGDAGGCAELAGRYRRGEGGPKAPARARSTYEKACNLGAKAACDQAAEMYRTGDGGPKSETHARDLMEKGRYDEERACERGDGLACFKAAELRKGDDVRQRNLHEKACNAGHAQGCAYLGIKWQYGSGGPKDEAQARALYEKACKIGDEWACGTAAEMRRNYQVVEKSNAQLPTDQQFFHNVIGVKSPMSSLDTQLFDAACKRPPDQAAIRSLLAAGARPTPQPYAFNSLFCLVGPSDTASAKLLLDAGADPSIRWFYNKETVRDMAVRLHRDDFVRFLDDYLRTMGSNR